MQSEEDNFISIPDLSTAPQLHLGMQYFIPEWDDRVDPGYKFLKNEFTSNRDTYTNDVYAHEMYSSPNYDGILVSKVVVDKKKSKRAYIEEIGGIHNFVRFPGKPIMGDCGAFGYINEPEPPYKTEDILEYYERLGFNYGVSIDHLIVGIFAEPEHRDKRYELTIKNAEDFIHKHHARGYSFIPIGVAQGWSPETYADAVKALIDMGYNYVALGGLARAPSQQIIKVLKAVYPNLKPNTQLHIFGVGRINLIEDFRHLGVTSFDSASPLRSAWLDSKANYHILSGETYAAVRIPPVDKHGVRIKRVLEAGISNPKELKRLEQDSLQAMREFDADKLTVEETLSVLLAYDKFLELPVNGEVKPEAQDRRLRQHAQMYRKLLEDKPWRFCDCPICEELKVEVVIFRGNDRNRRRGFHNTYVFYKRFKEILKSKI
jgi:hypothetical protein